jgi:ADP-ribosylglycohydrolase
MNDSSESARALANRVAGVLFGLAAGDRNGEPTEMAVRLAESLSERGAFDASDVLERYVAWWRAGAQDTGEVAARVLEKLTWGIPVAQAVQQADQELKGHTAGCNPAHRTVPLAMASFLPDDALVAAAQEEALLTHAHPLAGDVAAAVAVLCRALIRGYGWGAALQLATKGRMPATVAALRPAKTLAELSRGGFAPDVLKAAVQFLTLNLSFGDALDASLRFAGPANYCPVLVGAIGGARWGAKAVGIKRMDHCADIDRLKRTAGALAKAWEG